MGRRSCRTWPPRSRRPPTADGRTRSSSGRASSTRRACPSWRATWSAGSNGATRGRAPRRAAQPSGFPDRIEFAFGSTPADQTKAVEAGRADWMADDPPAADLQALTTQFAGRVHPFQKKQTFYLALNTTKPPFDDLRVRQAV